MSKTLFLAFTVHCIMRRRLGVPRRIARKPLEVTTNMARARDSVTPFFLEEDTSEIVGRLHTRRTQRAGLSGDRRGAVWYVESSVAFQSHADMTC